MGFFFCSLSAAPALTRRCGTARRGEDTAARLRGGSSGPPLLFSLPSPAAPPLARPGPAQPCPAATGSGAGAGKPARCPGLLCCLVCFVRGNAHFHPALIYATRSCGRTCEAQRRAERGRSPCARLREGAAVPGRGIGGSCGAA